MNFKFLFLFVSSCSTCNNCAYISNFYFICEVGPTPTPNTLQLCKLFQADIQFVYSGSGGGAKFYTFDGIFAVVTTTTSRRSSSAAAIANAATFFFSTVANEIQ